MELRVLRYFLLVAQEGSITNAATRLHVGQPTLSRQLKDLEKELGQKLFTRQAHGIRLTEAGEQLRMSAKEMVAISEKIEQDFALMATRPLGDVYIGGVDGYLKEGARLAHIARKRGVNTVMHYTSCSSPDAIALLDRGLIDFAIVSQTVRVDRFETIHLSSTCRWVALMRNDNPLASREYLTAADLAREPLLMYDNALKAPSDLNDLAQWFGDAFAELNVVATSNLTTALGAYAREGLGILLTWEHIATVSSPDMTIVPLSPSLVAQGILAWRKDRPLSKAAANYLSLMRYLME
ncbi:MAG: LysR family transcriptional regulator [Atopobiaceae bacterium]|nr:LysR family transcriptional regulator [Atopobiaceae bacterium]